MNQLWWQAAAPVLGLVVNVVVQGSFTRYGWSRSLLRSVVIGFAAGLAATIVISAATLTWGTSVLDNLARWFIAASTFLLLGYGYFHFLNLGETARRIRILREMADLGGSMTVPELLACYNGKYIVDRRLGRLLNSGQVICRDGRYFQGRQTILAMSLAIEMLGVIYLGRRKQEDEEKSESRSQKAEVGQN